MKTFLISLMLTGVAGATFTYETPEEYSTQADFTGDGVADVAVMDRATGSIRILAAGSDGGFASSGVIHTGLDRPDAFTAGLLPGKAGIAVSSLATNQALLIIPRTAQVVTLPLGARSSPSGLAMPSAMADTTASVHVATDQNAPPTPRRITRMIISSTGTATLGTIPDMATGSTAPLLRGNPLPWGTSRGMAFISAEQGRAASDLRIYRDTTNSGDSRTVSAIASGLPADSLWLHGRFASSDSLTGFLAYARDTSRVIPLETAAGAMTVTSLPAVDLDGAIHLLVTVPFASPKRDAVLAIFDKGARATLYDWHNGSAPQELQSWDAPPGKRFTRAAPLGNGSFLFLHGEGGRSTGWARMDHDGTRHVQSRTGTFPTAGLQRGAQVFQFNGQPFVDPAARLVEMRAAPDWTMLENGSPFSLTDAGPRSGLGNPTGFSIPSGFTLLNQLWRSADGVAPFSVSVLSNRLGAVPAGISFSPAAGSYSDPELSVELRYSGSLTTMRYRFSADAPWVPYNGPIRVTGPVTVFAKADGSNAVFSARYSTDEGGGTFPDLSLTEHQDLNGNGLPDFWEEMFGQSDPDADTDGDGKTALEEYLAGTDPRDSFSVTPEPPAPAFALSTFSSQVGGRTMFHVRWPAAHGDAVLQSSPDLDEWRRVTDGISPLGADYLYSTPVEEAPARFFRLKSD
ncbi:hypothetical protein OKA04_18695 [Luteolibacter flavescens]|uniref:VCBS repeat-containing protein n=1 Tax=Luteolibacter flavescens TaxID=1859460 RepID=A0ABT3FT80_9BACT|nr:hypothetical protein [Luteolibacter flavescens]MCW1886775.1 hypothetical protein [Luteolibacter flavescens]